MQKIKENNKQLKTYLCLFLLFITGLVRAQTDFRAGYVIDLKNDTLMGDIDYRGDVLMGQVCTFKAPINGYITRYAPEDIAGYRFKNDRFFVAREIKGKKVFLEFLIKGKISIYYIRDNEGDHYYIEKIAGKLVELPYKEGIKYDNNIGYRHDYDKNGNEYDKNKAYSFSSTTHIGILIYYMQDAPEFQSEIIKLKRPEHDDLIKLAKDYHTQVCKDETCIIYKKKAPPTNVNVEVVGGVSKYSISIGVVQKNYVNLGVFAHFWLPRMNEKLYFRTGIIYSKIDIFDEFSAIPNATTSINSYKIPLYIEYIYPKGKVRPVFAYGLNFYQTNNFTAGFMGGLNVGLSEKVALDFNYDVDFIPFGLLIPRNFFSHSAFLGLKIKL
jgi:hypothetical protein